MSEYNAGLDNEEEKIDLTGIVYDFLNALKRTWIIVLVLVILCSGLMYAKEKLTYTPSYQAEATVSVTTAGGYNGNDASSAAMIEKVFPYIMSSGMLSSKICESLGTSSVPGSVTMENISGTNLLTITVVSSDPDQAYAVLQAVIQNYDSITKYVVGNTTMEIYSDGGIPDHTTGGISKLKAAETGAAAGVIIGIAITVLYMLIYRTVQDSNDLQRLVNVRYLGTLPVYRKKKRKKGTSSINILDKNIQQNYLESMRLIRTRVESHMKRTNARVLMVTSSIPGEGKSTVACNLAAAMAKSGKSVVLVDCDLRNPSVQQVLGMKGTFPGIEALLNKEASYVEAARSYKDLGLEFRVIPGNKKSSDNAEIFSKPEMKQFLDFLKTKADYIILDTPPAGLLVDSSYITKHVDAVLYVVMCDFTRRHIIQRSIQELADTDVNIIGCILNGGKKHSSSSGYGYGYKKYGNYGDTSKYANKNEDEEE